jgi:hypothetical protein
MMEYMEWIPRDYIGRNINDGQKQWDPPDEFNMEGGLPGFTGLRYRDPTNGWSHMGHWENQVYSYVPSTGMWLCDAWRTREDWSVPGTTMDDWMRNNSPYTFIGGYDVFSSFDPSAVTRPGAHTGPASLGYPHDRVTGVPKPGSVYFYSHHWNGDNFQAGYTLGIAYWGGVHNRSSATVMHLNRTGRPTNIMGDDNYIFGDGHVESMTWEQSRCFTSKNKDENGWCTQGFLGWRDDYGATSGHYNASHHYGVSRWASCEEPDPEWILK